MKQDIILSLILHLIIVTMVVVSTPFDYSKTFKYDDVIKIKAVSFPDFSSSKAEQVEPISIPRAAFDEPELIPIDEPSTIDVPKPVIKPKKKRPKQPDKKKTPETETATSETGENQKDIDITTTGSGSHFGRATIDNASFDYPYWFTQAFNKINSNFRKTIALDGSVVCVIYFQVIRSGRVVELKIEQSSGIDAVDQDCLMAIERSAPFPPLPSEFRDEIIGITIPIKY